MRNAFAVPFFAVVLLGLTTAAGAAPDFLHQKPPALATPVPKVELAACRFWPCNCRNECVIYDQNGRCTSHSRTCDTCSKCDD